MSDGTTLLFGLPGVRVERVERCADGTRVVHVVTAEETAAACPSCGVLSTSVKARVITSPKDIPYGLGRILVRWHKTRWRCREDYCDRGSFAEAIAQVPARSRTTVRLRTAIGAAIGDAARSVSEVADSHGVSWPTAHRAFVAHAEALLAEPQPTPLLGIDETRRGKPRWQRCTETGRWVRVDPWDTGFVDLAGEQGLLGQREGRTSAAVIDWLSKRSDEFRAGVQFVAIDPAAVYASAIRTPGLLPNATIVVDHFHLVKLANDALTKVRRRVTWDLRDRRGRRIDPEWANRRRLLRARERLSHEHFRQDVEPNPGRGPQRPDPVGLDRERGTAHTAIHRAGRRRRAPDPPSPAPVPHLVHRLTDSRTAHPCRYRRPLVARDQRLRDHRNHQRPHRGLQPAAQTGQAGRMRIPESRQLGTPDTIPLHPQTAGRNPDFKLIARSKSKSRHSSVPDVWR